MTLNEAVKRYLAVTGSFGKPMPLSAFELAPAELREMVSGWEEDYHLSRHYELVPASYHDTTEHYPIDGAEYSGIIMRESIVEVLG
jgi:hypothetical protein